MCNTYLYQQVKDEPLGAEGGGQLRARQQRSPDHDQGHSCSSGKTGYTATRGCPLGTALIHPRLGGPHLAPSPSTVTQHRHLAPSPITYDSSNPWWHGILVYLVVSSQRCQSSSKTHPGVVSTEIGILGGFILAPSPVTQDAHRSWCHQTNILC